MITPEQLRQEADRLLSGEDIEGATLLRGQRPPIFDGLGMSAIVLLLVTAVAWVGVARGGNALEPLTLLTTFVAAAASARLLAMFVTLWPRFRVYHEAPEHSLSLLAEGLVWRSPDTEVVLPRESIVAIQEQGQWQRRAAGRRYGLVWVIAQPRAGTAIWALPPIFDETPGMLASRLERWRGSVEPYTGELPEDDMLPSARYDAAAKGVAAEGMAWIRHGLGWLRRGPYAGPLFALITAPALASVPAIATLLWALLPLIIAIPFGWLLLSLREVRPRKGLSMVLTPTELLLRTRGGVLRTQWSEMQQIHLDSSPGWTLLDGFQRARRLVITRRDDPPIRYDETYLGFDAEAVQRLLNAYRKGLLPR